MEPTNIFFIITTIFVGVLIILFLIIGFYIWKIMRIGKDVAGTIQDFSHSLKDEGEQVLGVAQTFRKKVASSNISNGIITGVLLAIARGFLRKKK